MADVRSLHIFGDAYTKAKCASGSLFDDCADCGAKRPRTRVYLGEQHPTKYRCTPCVLAAYRETFAKNEAALQAPPDPAIAVMREERIQFGEWLRGRIAELEAEAKGANVPRIGDGAIVA